MYNNKVLRGIIATIFIFLIITTFVLFMVFVIYMGISDGETREPTKCKIEEKPIFVYVVTGKYGVKYYNVLIKVNVIDFGLEDQKAIYSLDNLVREKTALNQIEIVEEFRLKSDNVLCWIPKNTVRYSEEIVIDTDNMIVIDYNNDDAEEYYKIAIISGIISGSAFLLCIGFGIYLAILLYNEHKS